MFYIYTKYLNCGHLFVFIFSKIFIIKEKQQLMLFTVVYYRPRTYVRREVMVSQVCVYSGGGRGSPGLRFSGGGDVPGLRFSGGERGGGSQSQISEGGGGGTQSQ